MADQPDEAGPAPRRQWRSRRIPDDEYDVHRAKILDLYLKQKKSRDDIIKTLADEDHFVIRYGVPTASLGGRSELTMVLVVSSN
jgi:hypothetical protein